jgi:NAD(P)-dependent dehydrogenase (short-subunit alcohol dehydrogenase family)
VTGAGSGIGRATAERFAKQGWRAIVTDIDEQTGQETVDRITAAGGVAVFHSADSSSADEWAELAEWTCSEYGIPDLVVNNAGILIGGNFMEQTGDDWRRMIQINLMGPILGSRAFIERMVADGKRGHIVNIASCGAFMPTSIAPSYVDRQSGRLFRRTGALRSESSDDRESASARSAPGSSGPGWPPTAIAPATTKTPGRRNSAPDTITSAAHRSGWPPRSIVPVRLESRHCPRRVGGLAWRGTCTEPHRPWSAGSARTSACRWQTRALNSAAKSLEVHDENDDHHRGRRGHR